MSKFPVLLVEDDADLREAVSETLSMARAEVPISSVWPSAGALATRSEPMMPLAPAWFSVTIGWPRSSESFGSITRA